MSACRLHSRYAPLGLLLLSWLALAQRARAAGLEDTVAGALGLGRAASFARVDDFLATWQNPANLALLPGRDLGLELRATRFVACYDRAYDPDVAYRRPDPAQGFEGTESVAEACNRSPLGAGGNLGWAQSFASGFGYGIGLFTPASVGSTRWGTDTIVTVEPQPDERYPITSAGVESPTRQMSVERGGRGAYLAAGLGWAPVPQLRLGGSVAVGYLRLHTTNVASILGGTFRDQELLQEADVSDRAVPRATAAMVVSSARWFELFATLTYQDDIRATGDLELTANGVRGEPLADCRASDPGTHCRIRGVRFVIPQPRFEATWGVRIAQRRRARTGKLEPMKDELWDLEIDASWAQTSRVDAFRIQVHEDPDPGASGAPDTRPRVQLSSSPDPNVTTAPLPSEATIPVRWRDTWTVRVGGDFQALPEHLSLRAGLSYASQAVATKYMTILAWPVQKVGLHIGATVRLGWLRATLAYAHLFYRPTDVPVGSGQVKEVVRLGKGRADAINEGLYRAALDVFSLQLDAVF